EFLIEPDRHIDSDFVSKSRELASLAHFRGSYAAKQFDNLSLVAIPAKKYDQLIIVGGTQHFNLNRAIEYRVWIMLLILLLSLIIVLLASYYSARLILDPIETLKSALDRVANGHLTTEIESHSQDELGMLCSEFSTMAVGLRERKRLATLLSDQAMDAITKTGSGQRMLGNESFSGVALVSDIRNFTGLCEDYPPDMITELLNEHFAGMASIISSHGGRIYKFIGDAVEAVFPENSELPENAATRAFNAASLMLIKAKQINQMRARRKLFNYRIGIGLAYGTMHAGSIGSLDTRLDYAIIGEPLKLAAKLEALSVQNQDFPLVIDECLSRTLSGQGIIFKEFAAVEGKAAFSLYEVGGEHQPLTVSESKESSGKTARGADEVERFVVGSGKTLSPTMSFALGVALIITIVGGIIFAAHIRKDAARIRATGLAISSNQRTIEQIRSENAPLIGFETNCRKLVASLERKITDNPEFIKTQLTDFLKSSTGKDTETGKHLSRMAVYLVEPEYTSAKATFRSKTAFVQGWSESQSDLLSKQAATSRLLVEMLASHTLALNEHERQKFVEIFGDQQASYMLQYEMLGKASEIFPATGAEYFYWDYIVTGSNSNRKGAFAICEEAKIVGYFLAAIPAEKLKKSAAHLVESYETASQKIAMLSPNGAITCNEGFPLELKKQLSYNDALPAYAGGVVSNDYMQLGPERFRLIVCSLLDEQSFLLSIPLLIAGLLISVTALAVWWKTSQGETFINSSLTAKLWLALLLASIVPLITVFFVFGLFTDEDYSVSLSKERSELHRFIDLFELRESYVDPLAWKMVRNWSTREQTQNTVELISKESKETGQISSHTFKLLRKVINSWYSEHNKLNKKIINFYPRDIVLAGDGWTFVSSGMDNPEPSRFGIMLQGVAKNMANRRISKVFKAGLDSEAVQSEIIVETGLQTVRSLFGDDVFVRMAHSAEIPVLMSAISGTIGIITHMVPDITQPKYLILWMMAFEYDSYLSRLANRQKSKYSVFAAITHRHGSMLDPYMADYRHDLGLTGGWITSANLPVSRRLERGGEGFIVEGRPGVSQLSSFIVAAASEAPVQARMAKNKLIFGIALFFSIILILVVAKNAAADILNPVESLITGMKFASVENYSYRINMKRGDELGKLCNSFDSMMRGLEEKNLMGRMLSKSALNYTTQNSSESSKGEFVFLYIGIPSFMSWVAGASVEQMFIDLKEQIALISGFVMGEGGDIDKIIGDKMLAVFAVEGNLPGAVASACHAAEKIISAESKANLPFPVAIGINSGKVITGLLGVGEKRDFTVIGDAVNVAARIENLSETLRYQRCLLSENVYAALKPGITAREYGEVELKGKAMPMKVYQLSL
ncbi:MAG: adenylate/guanylate cyclase, partial [uncultured bacterium]